MQAVPQLYLPALFCPIPEQVNPQLTQTEAHNLDWGIHFSLTPSSGPKFEEYRKHRYANIASRAFPQVKIEHLNIATDWASLLSNLDDIFDRFPLATQERAQLEKRLLSIAAGNKPPPQEHPSLLALYDIILRLQTYSSPFWQQRFLLSLRNYIESVSWEKYLEENNRNPSLTTYEKLRFFNFGAPIAFALLGAFHNFKRPGFLKLAYFQQLENMANYYSSCCNDLLGIGRELVEGNNSNIVIIIKNHYQLNMQQAVNETVRRINEELKAFLELEEEIYFLPESKNYLHEIQLYISGLRHWMRGNLDWPIESGRYQKFYLNPIQVSRNFPEENKISFYGDAFLRSNIKNSIGSPGRGLFSTRFK